MTAPGATRRGRPLAIMALLIFGWIGLRIASWPQPQIPGIEQMLPSAVLADYDDLAAPGESMDEWVFEDPGASAQWAAYDFDLLPAWHPVDDGYPFAPHTAPLRAPPWPTALAAPSASAGAADDVRAGRHGLMWLAAVTRGDFNYPNLGLASNLGPTVSRAKPVSGAAQRDDRWSADVWLTMREGAAVNPGVAPASYGGSQGGALLRYRLAPGGTLAPVAYGRLTASPQAGTMPELAVGMSVRPFESLPIRAQLEMRLREYAGRAELRPAAVAVGQFERSDAAWEARGYAQAGYVGGDGATVFADGKLSLAKVLADRGGFRLTAGGGSWGGAQEGVSRLDIGPTAALTLATGQMTARVEADYRIRVAGNAAPDSGPALTLAASF